MELTLAQIDGLIVDARNLLPKHGDTEAHQAAINALLDLRKEKLNRKPNAVVPTPPPSPPRRSWRPSLFHRR